jgi:hypothetical protein
MSKICFGLFVAQFAFGFCFMAGHQDANQQVNILYALPFLTSMGWFALSMCIAGTP